LNFPRGEDQARGDKKYARTRGNFLVCVHSRNGPSFVQISSVLRVAGLRL
jgi:hypothetical protein